MTAYARFAPIGIAVAVLIFAPAAQAMIQVDAGIAGARIGNTREQVARRRWASPPRSESATNDFGPFVEFRFAGGIRVTFQGKTNVTAVQTTRQGRHDDQRDRRRLEREPVKSRIKGVTCEGVGSARSCHTGSFTPGKIVTDFRIASGKVDERDRRRGGRLGQAPELAGQPDAVQDRLRLLERSRAPVGVQAVAVPAAGELGQRREVDQLSRRRLPPPTGGAASSLR